MWTPYGLSNKGSGSMIRFSGAVKHVNERGDSNIIGVKYNKSGIGNNNRTITKYFKDQLPQGYVMPKSDRGIYANDIHEEHGISHQNYYQKSSINRPNYTENKNFRITDSKGKGKINLGTKWS